MRRRRSKIQLTESGKKLVACVSIGIVALAVLLFLVLFRVSNVLVVGNTRYTDEEIKQYAMSNILTHNTMLATWFHDHKDIEDIPFLESFDYERVDNTTLRIHVNEKQIIGYILQGTDKLYFDKDGMVAELETMTEEEIAELENAQQELEALKAEAERQEALKKAQEAEEALTGTVREEESEDTEEEEVEPVQIDTAQVLQAEEVSSGTSGTQHQAAVTDVPRVIGLIEEEVKLGETIPVEDEEIFYTILGITRMVEKYDILPEILWFDKNREVTLVYYNGNVHCQLGEDILMEEKITRVATILPELEDLTGILHLEDYTEDTVNIIFSQESLYDMKMKIMEAYSTDGLGNVPVSSEEDTSEEDVQSTGESAEDGAEPTGEPAGDGAEPTGEAVEDGVEPTAEPSADETES